MCGAPRKGPSTWCSKLGRDGQRLLRPRVKRPRGRRAAEQREELASLYVEHGLPLGTRCASLQQAQHALEAPAGPWARPESF
jgi:hypothetical protein